MAVTARDLIAEAEGRGVRFEVVGERLRATPRSAIDAALYDAIGAHKAEVLRELRHRDVQVAPPPPSVIVAEAAKLLRDCRWPPMLAVCAFSVGHAGERCRRCGASWIEHYAPGDNAKRPDVRQGKRLRPSS
jgi:hypothetical protein